MHKNSLLPLLAFALIAGGLVGCGENSVPENPSWSRDIQPLMEAHCVRCHGGGGMLNPDPDISLSTAKKIGCATPTSCAPNTGNFTTQAGIMPYTTGGGGLLKASLALPMPPPPSEPLTSFEYDLLMDWAANPLP